MRIIAGGARGTRLKMVPGKHVRPTADRVKESLFSVIGPFFDGGKGLDLFAGTGALGLEALSRGMDHVTFVDDARASVDTIKENLGLTKMADRATLIKRDARTYVKTLADQARYAVIFLDPPYHEGFYESILTYIGEKELLTDEGTLVVEHPSKLEMPSIVAGLSAYRQLSYGDTAITLYEYSQT
ncbi:16S rRNA (guanine(966)-N(2))-methyltransferase RsmD [Thermoactinomyces sp. DSM 45892]|uniref:16S rRNA (guanine(966)-N(2))-methyltransferase RsmD n=1 Tax=Thermoactinomyces sp. DSM 45892 TaxID=1882753 RepID=UPI000894A728|nr:16S rRNA (guanine(966)-N(2))-methyltransferase RsmD [Thermoactinomyces sp. DSM 45892]SDX99087.1 16S rRNA (guanine(966)-N(2))-methyltransferase RsmD [Thermoactinomyces sp. DSM 45892]